jgi:anion-transporting  ArsA/GET3 family ATPase
LYFYNISLDSLDDLIENKILLDVDFQGSSTIGYWTDKGHSISNVVRLKYDYNPRLEISQDSTTDNALNRLELMRIDLKEKLRKIEREKEEHRELLSEIKRLNDEFESMSLANQESAVNRLKTLDRRKLDYHFSELSTEKILKQIEQLENEINQHHSVYFTGKFTYLNHII